MRITKELSPKALHSERGFVHRYQKLVHDTMIPYQYEILHDRIEGAEKSHVVANFINAAKSLRGEDPGDGFYGMVFQDSDAAKWIEAAAYSLMVFPDSDLEKKADELIRIVSEAQDADGYLNTYFTIKDRDKRWKNLLEGHELYCSGHFMEAAVAYFDATGKRTLLDTMLRNAEHIYEHFITKGAEGYPGHPEVELALLRLYRATGNQHCLALAEHFINARGQDRDFYQREAAKRDWNVWGMDPADRAYNQSHLPVREQSEVFGHSVRAMYLCTAMADLAAETDDPSLLKACIKLWESTTERKMYLTGGIGSTGIGEAFTADFDLPNDTAYAETCASIGLMFFAQRMLSQEINGNYADILERAFYNTVLAGIALDGKRFFYVNPLEVIPGVSGEIVTHKHVIPQRPGWYMCACCPPNAARTIMSLASYAYSENENTVFAHLFIDGQADFENGISLRCETDYPYDLTVNYEILSGSGTLALRIPEWSQSDYQIKCNDASVDGAVIVKKGYAYIENVKTNDKITIVFNGDVQKIYANPQIFEDSGCVALQRGPLVYCFEGTDNADDILSVFLKEDSEIRISDYDPTLLSGTVTLTAEGFRREQTDRLYLVNKKPAAKSELLTAIPYYTWGNRGLTQMRVWVPEA